MAQSAQSPFDDPVHDDFRAALQTRGIIPPEQIIADGDIHRCDVEGDGDSGKDDGAYVLHYGGFGGFENWRDGAGWENWHADTDRILTTQELAELRQQAESARQQRGPEAAIRHAAAAQKAAERWFTAAPSDEQHPYLKRKAVQPHGTRVTQNGDLVVPLRDADGGLRSLQFIKPDGSKKYLKDGRVTSCYYSIGGAPSTVVLIGTGFATCASAFESTKYPTAVAFSDGNLLAVAPVLREKYPNARIVVLADDDYKTVGNPGLAKAKEAAAAVGGAVAVPDFGPSRPDRATDFNDMARHAGAEAVKRCIEAVMAPNAQQGSLWPEPDMAVLRLHRRQPPALPLELFGPDWGRWIATAAESAACAPDYVAAPLLASVSTLIGHARWAQANDGWSEPPHLWLGAVGDSGTGKSPGADPLFRDILPDLERRMLGDFPDRLRLWRTAVVLAEAANKEWQQQVKDAQKGGTPPPAPPIPAGPEPQAPRLRQNDVTIEKVAELLANSAPKGVLMVRDELAGWITGMNNYNSAARPFWIEAFGGRPYRQERKKNPEPIIIPRLAVAVYGGIQPDKLSPLMREGDDGLLARFLWVWPELVLFRLGTRAPGLEWAADALDRLRELDLQPGDPPQPIKVPLVADVLPLLEEFARDLQQRQINAGGLLRSALGKGRGLTLRLSLVLELLWWCGAGGMTAPPATISVKAFAAAAALFSRYLLPMAERVYGDAALPDSDRNAATIARWIVRQRLTVINAREVRRKRLPGLSDAGDVRNALAVLVDATWLFPIPSRAGATPGRQREDYTVNPRVFEEPFNA